jgi:hypothetical protein
MADKKSFRVNVELTDTFGGEANYSWCKRETFFVPEGTSDLAIVRRAKAAIGLTGAACKRSDLGDMIELRPIGSCTVCFISFEY